MAVPPEAISNIVKALKEMRFTVAGVFETPAEAAEALKGGADFALVPTEDEPDQE